ncbi:MAG: aminotransferase class III-fold pyridoxal phosphate-dependent enzyme [Bacteroidetes bacterium]|nr:aminotransferase class III-fold pyridoxal phosphate-dependent enzyme [Bacteroidota bacterium]
MIHGNNLHQTEAMLRQAESIDAWAWSELNDTNRTNYSAIRGAYPFYAHHAKGAYLWDVDGNQYIDYMLGYGTIVLGHTDERVTSAVCQEIQSGHLVSPLWKPQQIELTKTLTSVIPKAEMAYLMKTGSDAASGAIRLARIKTRRDKVIRWGYNGWHDWATPRPVGVPSGVRKDVFEFTYNDIDSLHKLFKSHPDDIACVFMMPFELEKPKDEFLHEVREIAHKNGALFILDEMRSGFRLALGGAQEFFNIQADLATYSKSMSNGYSISAIVGRADVLKGISQTKMTATYFGSSAEMAAAHATIAILKQSDTIEHIWSVGQLFLNELKNLVHEHKVPAEVVGYPPYPFLQFVEPDAMKREGMKRKFYTIVAQNGVFFHPNHHWYICGAHTEADILRTIDICRKGFIALQDGEK